MKLMTIQEYRQAFFTEASMPPARTVRHQLAVGVLPGTKIGDTWYIDREAFEADVNLDEPLLKKVING